MTDDRAAWLADEIDEALDADDVGLYEFIWTLNGRFGLGDVSDYRRIAMQAFAEIRQRRPVRLVRAKWATEQRLPLPPDYVPRDEDWDDIPEDGWYLALITDAELGQS